MARREVKGLHRATSKGHTYWYAWRGPGAPQVKGEYGTPEFWASYDTTVRERHVPDPGRFRSPVATKLNWNPGLHRITDYFGDLSMAAFDNPRVRSSIRAWRNKYAGTPRTADMGMQVLSVVCAHARHRAE